MRIIIAPDSFKGSLSASLAAKAIAAGIRKVFSLAQLECLPMADGGEGTVESLVAATNGHIIQETVLDPLGEPIVAFWGILGDGTTAVVEMAAASGLSLVPPKKRNPLKTTTFGTGQLIAKALNYLHSPKTGGKENFQSQDVQKGKDIEGKKHGTGSCSSNRPRTPKLIIAIGGSATNDGGVGALQALGIKFTDANGRRIGFGGESLGQIAYISETKKNPLLGQTEIFIACDVNNPLCGPKGASVVFGPQKGATAEMIRTLDRNLAYFASLAKGCTGKDMATMPGAGAAGGLGAGLLFFTEAQLAPGIKLVHSLTDFEARVATADLIFTGEGQTDSQTVLGKVPAGIGEVAKKHGVPVICLSGGLDGSLEELHNFGIHAFFSATPKPLELKEAMEHSYEHISALAEQVCRALCIGGQLPFKKDTMFS